MAGFVPYNKLELALRKLLAGENESLAPFLERLAGSPVWLLVENDLRPDAEGTPARDGKFPEVTTFHRRNGSFLGVYTAEERAREVMRRGELSPEELHCTRRDGDTVLRWFHAEYGEAGTTRLVVNHGLDEGTFPLDADVLRQMVARPVPGPSADAPPFDADPQPADVPVATLGPLRDFLAGAAGLRGAFVLGRGPGEFFLGLVMAYPQDESLLDRADLILRAVTPVETEWTAGMLIGSDETFRRIAAEQEPFFATAEFAAALRG